jgi:hypothetical protein
MPTGRVSSVVDRQDRPNDEPKRVGLFLKFASSDIKGQASIRQTAATPLVRVRVPHSTLRGNYLAVHHGIMPEVLIQYRNFDYNCVTGARSLRLSRWCYRSRCVRICKTADHPRAWLTWVFTLLSYEILTALAIRSRGHESSGNAETEGLCFL